jgi:hypothetical protein
VGKIAGRIVTYKGEIYGESKGEVEVSRGRAGFKSGTAVSQRRT